MKCHIFLVSAVAVLAATGSLASPLPTDAQSWSGAQRITVHLSSFAFQPGILTLHHGQPYVLHLANDGAGAHDFAAKTFFAGARVASEDRDVVAKGQVELAGGATADIHLIAPAPGTYELHCGHFMHAALGMKGEIRVD